LPVLVAGERECERGADERNDNGGEQPERERQAAARTSSAQDL
jgi:hypothetical protein